MKPMKKAVRATLAVAAAATAGLALTAPTASAETANRTSHERSHPVFVETDNASGNQVIAYRRASDGSLSLRHAYNTGGLGGALDGAAVDFTASQGALAYDAAHHTLLAVNAGSDDVSVFAVNGTSLRLLQVVDSGGSFPVSVTTHGRYAYVLNARDGGSVQGYVIANRRLHEVGGWNRPLGLDPGATPEFTHTPGQVGFSPSGRQLIVTTKANTNAIDVFGVSNGRVSDSAVANVKDGSVPFGFTFDHAGHLAVTETGTNSVTTYALHNNGTVTQLSSVATGQAATCWVIDAGRFLFASNAGSASESGLTTAADGTVTLLGQTATSGGTVDADATPDGRWLYVQGGAAGTVDAYRVNGNGSLTAVGTVTVPNAVGGEGIIAL
jgi:6-phosphogluconolactonase (cycloisomerase 2 family)